MIRVIPVLAVLAIMIYTLVRVIQSDAQATRGLPRYLWVILILLLPLVGSIIWWIFGRPEDGYHQPPPSAPDDDPDFLRRL